jgi:hypothetical protein
VLITISQRPFPILLLSKSHTNQQNQSEKIVIIRFEINNCMINKYTCAAEKPANEWLAENGLCAKQLLRTELEIQQAQICAYNLIQHHADHLTVSQVTYLNKYLKAAIYYNTRIRLQKHHAYKVMNIGSKINRKVFKQNRQLKTQ